MKWTEISIATSHEATEVVADIFHDLGASGVVIEDPELINSYRRSGQWDYCDIPEEPATDTVIIKAYLPVDDYLDQKLRTFEERVEELDSRQIDKGSGTINLREVQDEDWASAWKDFFHPVKISDRLVIKPSWESYQPDREDVVIAIDPGMAFGTGTHHTTAMCGRELEAVIAPGTTVIDVGTGSGILAIIAAKLGAKKVLALDFDSVAVRTARENMAINNVQDIVEVAQNDLLTGISMTAEVVVANIIADIVINLVGDVIERLTAGGAFIAGGIIKERLGEVSAELLKYQLTIEKVVEEGGWVTIVARKGGG